MTAPPPLKRCPTKDSSCFLPEDFVKPDPAFTKWETRKYILKELETCLKERLTAEDSSSLLDDSQLNYLSNPRARLFHIKDLLEENGITANPGDIAFEILEKYLNRDKIDFEQYPVKLVQLVMGFLHTDRLPCERTIFSFWNHSPFGPLRNAPELGDEEEEEEEQIKDVEEYVTYDDAITLRISPTSLFVCFVFVTIWLGILVAQMSQTTKVVCRI
jgi:hypothetical protein